MEKTLVVKTENGDVTVKKLALGQYAEVLKALNKLPGELGKLFKNDDEKLRDNSYILSVLPIVIAEALPEFAKILSVATDKDEEFYLKQCDLADVVDVTGAILEINNFQRIFESIKKIQARMKAKNQPAKASQ